MRVIAPYRFNPLGAHVDHQGGAVLARTLDRHTELRARPLERPLLRLRARFEDGERTLEAAFGVDVDARRPPRDERWSRYALAAAEVLAARHPLRHGLDGEVSGSMIAAGLSSSASFLLVMLAGLAHANALDLSADEFVDCVREVEHEHLGLTNGLQDQLSIVHGRRGAIARLSMDDGLATHVADPEAARNVRWLLCFSGVSRELVGSGFNKRVGECAEAAGRLHPGATRLGDVPPGARSLDALMRESPMHARRARHVFTEMRRVEEGVAAWARGDVERFGALMDASCRSSIEDYESGSEYLVALHEIATATPGVFGNRFSGGGYGGCLVMLVDAERVESISAAVLEAYLTRYPDKRGIAFCFVAGDADGVEVIADER